MFWGIPDTNTFHTFGRQHLVALLVVCLMVVLIFIFRKKIRNSGYDKFIRYSICALFIVGLLIEQIWTVYHGRWSFKESLPISICTITELVALYMLTKKSYGAFGFVYFGLVATTQAILTPSLSFGFPAVSYWCYFVKHGLLIVAPLYMIAVHSFIPAHKQLWKYIGVLLGLVPAIFLINYLTGGNYWFISEKTPSVSLLSYLGSYPWFLVSLLGLAVVLCYLYYLPFGIKKNHKKRVS